MCHLMKTNLTLIALGMAGLGGVFASEAIELEEGQQLRVRQILPTDCRVVRGFTHSPIDGREDTRYSNNVVGEWGATGGTPAVNYRRFNGNNGLHVSLPDGGFDKFQIRGDWKGNVYFNSGSLTEPDAQSANVDRADVRRVSFFYAEGALGQVSFFHVDEAVAIGKRIEFENNAEWEDWTQAIAAMTLDFKIANAEPSSVITVRVGDALDSRRFA